MRLEKALVAEDPYEATEALTAEAPAAIARFAEALPTALSGGFASVLVVTTTWDVLLAQALRSAALIVPASLEAPEGGTVRIHGREVEWLLSALRATVAEAPFSRFVGAFGPGPGMAVACVARVREAVEELNPLALPQAGLPAFTGQIDVLKFQRLVGLAIRGAAPPLERVQDALGLSSAELGELFGVSRQAIDQWKERGIPPGRRARVGNVVSAIDFLDRKLKAGRLPLIARRPAAAFGGQSLLDAVRAGRDAEVRDSVEHAFDWSGTA